MSSLPIGGARLTDATMGAYAATNARGSMAGVDAGADDATAAGTSFVDGGSGSSTGTGDLGTALRAHAMESAAVASPHAASTTSSAYASQRDALMQKLAPYASTMDDAELRMLEDVLRSADARGSFKPSEIARLVTHVEGSALGLPNTYLELADRAQRFAADVERDVDDVLQQLQRLLQSGQASAAEAMELLGVIDQVMEGLEQLQLNLRASYELAKTDPGAAEAKLRAGLGDG